MYVYTNSHIIYTLQQILIFLARSVTEIVDFKLYKRNFDEIKPAVLNLVCDSPANRNQLRTHCQTVTKLITLAVQFL